MVGWVVGVVLGVVVGESAWGKVVGQLLWSPIGTMEKPDKTDVFEYQKWSLPKVSKSYKHGMIFYGHSSSN